MALSLQSVCGCPRCLGLPVSGRRVCEPQGCTALSSYWYLDPTCVLTHIKCTPVRCVSLCNCPLTFHKTSNWPWVAWSPNYTDGSLAQTCSLSDSCPPAQHLAQTPPVSPVSGPDSWPLQCRAPKSLSPVTAASNAARAGPGSASGGAGFSVTGTWTYVPWDTDKTAMKCINKPRQTVVFSMSEAGALAGSVL